MPDDRPKVRSAGNRTGKRVSDGPDRDEFTRIEQLERAVHTFQEVVRTRKLEVIDDEGAARIVGEVVDGAAELRLHLVAGHKAQEASVVIYCCPDRDDLGAALGIQIWAGGNVIAELDVWEHRPGSWRQHLHVTDDR